MKKLILALFTASLIAGSAFAADDKDRSVTFGELPKKAQQFIKQHFADAKISYAQQDTDWFDGDYTVMFTDGCKVEFRKNGVWKEIECRRSEVPATIIPAAIRQFVAQRHATEKITQIDCDTRGHEVKLTSGIELIFDSKCNFLRYDN